MPLAYIMWIDPSNVPTHPIAPGGPPPGIWGGANQPFPTPPIHIPPQAPGSPPGIWGPTDPRPGWGLPTPPSSPGVPTHPIYYPPGIWGPTDPRPGWGLPGPQPPTGSPPGIWGGSNTPMPSPPIYIPPEGAEPPLGIWGPTDPRPGYGLPGAQPKPEHPIVLPPDLPPQTPEGGKIEWKTAWTPTTGWIVVGIPQEPHPVPSK